MTIKSTVHSEIEYWLEIPITITYTVHPAQQPTKHEPGHRISVEWMHKSPMPWYIDLLVLDANEQERIEAALSYALLGAGPKLVVIEAAELDRENLVAMMRRISDQVTDQAQVIVNTLVHPGAVEGWEVVEVQ